jgi:hypothetical protein
VGPTASEFVWTPAEDQGPGSYPNIEVWVTQPNNSLTPIDKQTFNASVVEINVPPELNLPATVVLNEGTPVMFTVVPSDVDIPANTFVMELVSGPPGLNFNPGTGVITWATSEVDGPGSYDVQIKVTDTNPVAVNEQHLSTTRALTILVHELNTPPHLTVPADFTTNELVPISVMASATDADLPKNGFAYSLVAPPDGASIDAATGEFKWTPNESQGGNVYTVTVKVTDTGSADPVNTQLSDIKSFKVTVREVNAAPVFTLGAPPVVNEDAGPQTLANWATNIAAGPPGDIGTTVTFQVSNDNNGLFSVQPSLSSAGTLTFTVQPELYGSANVTVIAKDDAGTDNGGIDTSAPQVFKITVNSVNDAPSFTKGPDQNVKQGIEGQSVPGWATALKVGPANEGDQSVTFQVTNDNNPLFSVQPAVSPDGTLTYTPLPAAFGSATVTVVMKDSGGTANGGKDSSASQQFTITVTPLRWDSIKTLNGKVALRWEAIPGRRYQVQYKTSVKDANWTNLLGEVIPDSDVGTQVDDQLSGVTLRLYRLELLP